LISKCLNVVVVAIKLMLQFTIAGGGDAIVKSIEKATSGSLGFP
jgi:hypothetical protein